MRLTLQLLLSFILMLGLAFQSNTGRADPRTEDETIRLWDVATGKELRALRGQGDVTALAFSPVGDILATGSGDRSIDLWNLDSGSKSGKLTGHTEAVQSIAFNPDGKVLASGSWDRTIKLWNVATGKEVATLSGHTGEVLSVAFSPDGKVLASGGGDHTVRIWDATTYRNILIFEAHTQNVNAVAFSADGKSIVTGSDDKTVKLFEVVNGRELLTLRRHSDSVKSVAFSPDGKTIISGSRDQTIKIWEASTGRELRSFKGHLSAVNYVAFSPDGKTIVSGSYDQTLKLWDVASGRELRTLKGHAQRVTAVAFSPNGAILASGSALSNDESPTLHILSVGVSHYMTTSKTSSQVASKDAEDVAMALEEVGRRKFQRVNVRLMLNFQATISMIMTAISKVIKEAKPQDTFVFFFSGYATSTFSLGGEQNQFSLFPSDGTGISGAVLQSWLSKIEAQHQLVILETNDSAPGFEQFIKRISKEDQALEALLQRDIVILANATVAPRKWGSNGFLTNTLLEGLYGGAAQDNGEVTSSGLVEFTNAKQSTMSKKSLEIGGKIKSYMSGDDFLLGAVSRETGSKEHTIKHHDTRPRPVTLKALPANNTQLEEEFRIYPPNQVERLNVDSTLSSYGRTVSEDAAVHRTFNPWQQNETPTLTKSSPGETIVRRGKDRALLIATDVYDHWGRLKNPIQDVRTIADELKNYYGFEVEIIENPTKKELLQALEKYSKSTFAEEDQLLIFFAGHGNFIVQLDEGYLVARDSLKKDEDIFGDSCIPHSMLRKIINAIPCKHILLVLDACFGGTFDEVIARRGDGGDYDDATNLEFIERKMQFKTRQYLTAGGKEYVSDGIPGRNSPFVRRFLEALRSYGGKYGVLTITGIYSYLERAIPTPVSGGWGGNEPGSDFIFVARKPR